MGGFCGLCGLCGLCNLPELCGRCRSGVASAVDIVDMIDRHMTRFTRFHWTCHCMLLPWMFHQTLHTLAVKDGLQKGRLLDRVLRWVLIYTH